VKKFTSQIGLNMEICVARPEYNEEIQQLQAKCPQGTDIIFSVIKVPGIGCQY
jgi:hypothetical protein